MRNNNREVIGLLAGRQYQSNRGRNTILIAATALAVLMIFCVFSITAGKINTDYLLYMRSSGTAASTTLEYADQNQYEQIKRKSERKLLLAYRINFYALCLIKMRGKTYRFPHIQISTEFILKRQMI